MMPHTDLALLKAHLNIDHDHDDALLTHKLAAAESWVNDWTGECVNGHSPARVVEAVLQLAAHWYANREAATAGALVPVPFGVTDLLRSSSAWDTITGARVPPLNPPPFIPDPTYEELGD